ncbi:tumor necrosis factor receptor superfamily member 21-like [Silurus asotus]|uniref:Tumor necrosis factor receptor superfamily member 21-like n=1 Tax=Silurus asotus TaxID=30991 RepID=A0AAD5AUA6_SILAS|nr:tumor necrosis factor receptor superfamily member 21-like [Silurus asotus]
MKTWPWLLLSVLIHMVPPACSAPSPSTSRPGGVLKCPDGHYMFPRNGELQCSPCMPSCTVNKNQIEVAACTKTSNRQCLCEKGFFCPSPVSRTCRKDCLPCTNGFTSTPNLNISCQKFKECARGEQVITNGSSTADHVCGILSEGGPALPFEANLKTTWIFFLLLLIALCLVLCLSLKCKSRAIKCRLEQAGLVFRRYQPVFPGVSPNTDAPVPVSDVTDVRDQSQGQGSFPGKNQKVTMEHVGKSDGINNTVGSIFIYSPGMVILGSNSNEKKEEVFSGVEEEEEEEEEDVRLMSVPQQESSSEEVLIRLATQEELDKELSIPVPATSK